MQQPRYHGSLVVAVLTAALALSGCTADQKARAYAADDRDEWQQPDRVMEALAIAPGQSIADLGAGGGYFTFRLANTVGPDGRVYAIDVDADMTERLERIARERGASNVSVVLADFDDPKIPELVDLIFTSNTYHHIEGRVAYFERAARYLRPRGRIAILEYKSQGLFHRIMGHATEAGVMRSELEQAGYTLIADFDFVEQQHFLIFDRPSRDPLGI
ncbi:MAG: class I SAM-dependent methyltransferase [Myxococcales bacterium]|nr:class I SAM-dependent methyltransferase [Myxococcales bacterium]HIL80683.1 class I SAM-dependent methyltransferase [Myxococcales bacterium]